MAKPAKTLLIIGAGREQIRAYQLAREMGFVVIGTDIDKNAPAFRYADKALICSTRNVEKTVEVVSEFAKRHPIQGVMTIANDVPFTVASVAEKLGLRGIVLESARLASDKRRMKELFVRHGVETPKYWILESKEHFQQVVADIEFPLILKPIDGRGSRGVLYLDSDVDLDWAWDVSAAASEFPLLILEEFIAGPQLSVEGLFVGGKYVPVAFADRNYDNLPQTKPYIVEDGGQIPSRYEGNILNQIAGVVERAALSLGINGGPVKADIVLDATGSPFILELAARLSGNYLASHHIPYAYGIDLVGAVIKQALGLEVSDEELVQTQKKYLGVRYFFPPVGRITKIAGADRVRALEYVRMLEIYRSPGDDQPNITSHGHRAGTIICEADDYATAKARVEDAVAQIKFVAKAILKPDLDLNSRHQ